MKYLNSLAEVCFRESAKRGFWDEDRNKGEMLALIHSEVSEVLEAIRDEDEESEKIASFTREEEELADIIIRVLDYAGGFNLDIAGALEAKLSYNKQRPYRHGRKF